MTLEHKDGPGRERERERERERYGRESAGRRGRSRERQGEPERVNGDADATTLVDMMCRSCWPCVQWFLCPVSLSPVSLSPWLRRAGGMGLIALRMGRKCT